MGSGMGGGAMPPCNDGPAPEASSAFLFFIFVLPPFLAKAAFELWISSFRRRLSSRS
jgi:hypothetical protein